MEVTSPWDYRTVTSDTAYGSEKKHQHYFLRCIPTACGSFILETVNGASRIREFQNRKRKKDGVLGVLSGLGQLEIGVVAACIP